MRLTGPNDLIRKSIWREAERSRGQVPGFLRMSATRAADVQVPDTTKLPCRITTGELFAVDGRAFFLLGYSKLDGPDILR